MVTHGTGKLKDLAEIPTPHKKKEQKVQLETIEKLKYSYMIVAAGLEINWEGIKGLKESIGKNGVCTI